MNTKFEELHDFFGAYFHQDWTIEHESAEEVISAFLTESDIDVLRLVQQEINLLIRDNKDEQKLREYLLKELSCYYCYWNEWGTGEHWLLHIASRLDIMINQLDSST
ncbi:hypothetical protein HU742_002700 [Pseudomonas sp. SWRI102]|uniref:CdiI immunity protein domain-containing protein n=1 Tax=Pseudomonas marvdashtae TaxID=2745500 RepID=A0A923FUA1_9PSED|nr:hypothetical protein [Pseudomonas marvdashtae]